MEYVVIDLEWNQPESPEKAIKKPVALPGEIIQIGAVRLNENAQITDTFSALVKPLYYTKLNEYVSELTHITEKSLAQGISFRKALDRFIKWCPKEFVFLTWSNGDVKMLKQNIKIHGRDASWLPVSVDLQALFSNHIVKEKRRYSLTEASAYISNSEFIAHNALNDAVATAEIARYLKQNNINFFSSKVPSGYTYANAKAARKSRQNCTFICSNCQKEVTCTWLSNQGHKTYSLPVCSCGTEYFVRLIMKANKDSTVTANRTVSIATAADKEFYKQKQKQEKIKRTNRHNYWHNNKTVRKN